MTQTAIKSRKEAKTKSTMKKILSYILLSIFGVSMIVPFLWMVSTSLKEPGDVFTYPPKWIPKPIIWENYPKAWNAVPFARGYINSIFVGVTVTFGQVFTSSLAAYAFARLSFPGRDKLFLGYLGTMMIPGAVTMIPVFILLRKLGWIDTYKALIIPSMFSAYGTFMLRQFFMSLPTDLEDAAKIDGCSLFGIYTKIILPLSKPALATLTIFTFMGSWMSFMWPLIVTNSMELKTLPVMLASFQGLYTTDWTLLMAGSIIVLSPIVVVFILGQRYFVEGIKLGAIKG
ncbi:MAG: carbohydrate ABC transporter permease [Candidatus Omnitrophica bacterium]|nr:carbohydrate ABC transporter permease [Candidatus Omnitrophota bacterium]